VMGARYPVTADCRTPDAPPGRRGPGTAALLDAERAHVIALQAAVTHAAATAAQRTIDNEVRETRRRLHGIADRWIPRLEAALHEATQRIEESERAEALGLRWAARRDEEDDHDLADPARG
jgi:V/A-type H+/Na+-transporting ATPase subunit D